MSVEVCPVHDWKAEGVRCPECVKLAQRPFELKNHALDQIGRLFDKFAQRDLSLRDYFAAQMMAGVFAGGRQIDIAHEVAKQQRALEMNLTERQVALETNKLIATMCYEMSDAMLAERAKS